MTINIGLIMICLIIPFLIWVAYILHFNDSATEFIDNNEEEIRLFLVAHDLVLYRGRSWSDISPSEVTFGLRRPRSQEVYQLPSRKIKRILVKLKRGIINSSDALNYINKHGDLIQQPSQWSKI